MVAGIQKINPADIDFDRQYTSAEFEDLVFDHDRYELIEGRIYEMGATGDRHGTIIDIIYRYLVILDPQMKLGKVWGNTGFTIGVLDTPAPDLAFIVADRVPAITDKSVKVVPDLAIEVLSPTDIESKTRRNKTKKKITRYREAGVGLIWVINPFEQKVDVYEPQQEKPVATLKKDDYLECPDIIPGFKLKIDSLF
jgi:Uma2 family endonuclease